MAVFSGGMACGQRPIRPGSIPPASRSGWEQWPPPLRALPAPWLHGPLRRQKTVLVPRWQCAGIAACPWRRGAGTGCKRPWWQRDGSKPPIPESSLPPVHAAADPQHGLLARPQSPRIRLAAPLHEPDLRRCVTLYSGSRRLHSGEFPRYTRHRVGSRGQPPVPGLEALGAGLNIFTGTLTTAAADVPRTSFGTVVALASTKPESDEGAAPDQGPPLAGA